MASMRTVDEVLNLLIRSKPGMDRTMDGFQETVAAWHMVLEPIPDEAAWHAAVLLARGSEAFVNAGQVFQAALDLLDKEPSAEDAWRYMEIWARDPSAFNFGKELPRRIVRASLPLPRKSEWKEEDLPHLRRAFEAEYERLSQEWRRAAAMGEGRLLADGN